MEKILKRIGCPRELWVSNASFQLRDDAEFWWQSIERKFMGREHALTWEVFVHEFLDKFHAAHMRAEKKAELLSLKQGDMRILAYDAKFTELSQFAPELVATEEAKMFLFLEGMDPDLQVHVRGHRCVSLADMVDRAADIERGLMIQREAAQKRSMETPVVSQGGSSGSSVMKSKSMQTVTPSHLGSGHTRPSQCVKCGQRHSRGYRCDGTPLTCRTCGKQGHIAFMCRSRRTKRSGRQTQSIPAQTDRAGRGTASGSDGP
ncbi:hypothetical protein Dimus_038785 [Dionaea muscipula]